MSSFELDDRDVAVIVGSGAGGGTLANELCQRGIRCVVLEAGPHFKIADFKNDELAMAGKLAWQDSPEITSPAPLASSKPYVGKGVGGTTMIWCGISVRLRAWEMKPRTTYGALPGTSLIDWPISYDELAPYYSLAEKKMHVTGTHGNPLLPANNNFKVLYNGTCTIEETGGNRGRNLNVQLPDGLYAISRQRGGTYQLTDPQGKVWPLQVRDQGTSLSLIWSDRVLSVTPQNKPTSGMSLGQLINSLLGQ